MNLARTFLGEKFLEQGVKLIMRGDAEKHINTLLAWAEKIARDPKHKGFIEGMRTAFNDPNNNWAQLAHRMLNETDPNIRTRLAVNFFVNAGLLGVPRQREVEEKEGVHVPWAVLIDPTERCNLNCIGCWAGDYQRAQELDFATLDRVCSEAEQLGIYFIVVSGGEPLVRKDDILALAEKHEGQVFHLFTNGTLIDADFVARMKQVGNITTAISVDGFEEKTDARRGKGVFQKVSRAMDLLRENGCVFGVSVTYHRGNSEEVSSEEFVDFMIEKGVAYGWYFTYIPIGKDIDLEMMATPEQRALVYDRILEYRRTKPIFLVDFWNDGEAVNGCIAGGRTYFHINAAGEVEPCAFVHYATCNIKNVSLKEALQNPLFKAYQKRQPFHSNLRRPCPIIDNPEMLREIIKESGAYPTQLHQDETIDEFVEKIKPYSEAWGEVADAIWAEKQGRNAVSASAN
ncbi:MAG: radical SAM protein [Clostridia bacterium]|nr:radical SAM protein [Clostridia bacterium]MDH7574003.1 radical SAM protein [Clostridia bacterium]